ncbi:hypothetical protein DFJ73DRAFT_869869 [Zopfochytrium polystomum]|nr:hypothetical protein DFJ73DRAFT_869869 [Zopfochytrium polystomum]
MQVGSTGADGVLSVAWDGVEVRVSFDHEVLRAWDGFVWVLTSNGSVPEGALQGGVDEEGRPLYIARATVSERWAFSTPTEKAYCVGKTAPHIGGAAFGWKGKEVIVRRDYEILVTHTLMRWAFSLGRSE